MKRLNVPAFDALETFDACVSTINDVAIRNHFQANRDNVQIDNMAFDASSLDRSWCNLPRVPNGNPGVLISGGLSKAQLTELYNRYMVASRGASRDIYDNIITAARGHCPFCGGLGYAGTIDHYLPKANFPVYAVHPLNLVPCCRDCNSSKNASFGTLPGEQVLHPYLDHSHFFEERWIVATVQKSVPIYVVYTCTPSEQWSKTDKERAIIHFKSYQIPRRFSIQAGNEMATIVHLRRTSLHRLSPESFQEYLNEHAECEHLCLNGWYRTMYNALSSTDWFTHADFRDPSWSL